MTALTVLVARALMQSGELWFVARRTWGWRCFPPGTMRSVTIQASPLHGSVDAGRAIFMAVFALGLDQGAVLVVTLHAVLVFAGRGPGLFDMATATRLLLLGGVGLVTSNTVLVFLAGDGGLVFVALSAGILLLGGMRIMATHAVLVILARDRGFFLVTRTAGDTLIGRLVCDRIAMTAEAVVVLLEGRNRLGSLEGLGPMAAATDSDTLILQRKAVWFVAVATHRAMLRRALMQTSVCLRIVVTTRTGDREGRARASMGLVTANAWRSSLAVLRMFGIDLLAVTLLARLLR